MAYKHIGKNFTPPDVRAKVTGKAKYSEDFRAEGMLFIKLMVSPMPHAIVRNVDASEALKMDGVIDVMTADDVPNIPEPQMPILTNHPKYVGDPILAVAAISEEVASNALEKIKVEYESRPFVIDPLVSLFPGGPDVHDSGNVALFRGKAERHKWTARDFAAADDDELPRGKPQSEWDYGDVDGGFSKAALVLDETFVIAGHPHQSMEPRSAFAYWENGKCYLHASSQSHTFNVPDYAKYCGIETEDLILIAEYCGGGFGSKGTAYPIATIPAHMSKKVGRPCMMRISRAEEYYLGSRRNGFQGNVKLGFSEDGRLVAADLYVVQQSGANDAFPDYANAGLALSLVYQPVAMRWKGIPVATNTPPSGAQRGPGQNQLACVMEPLMDKAAKTLGVDRLAIRELNAPDSDSKFGGQRSPVSSAYLKEAMRDGAERFNWEEKKKESGQRNGSKVIGIGVGHAFHPGGSSGFDGLLRIAPDGKIHIHTGIGNLGTYSYASTSRVAAEVLGCSWENCVIERGDSRRHLPWNLGQFGSNTSYTMSRTNYAGAMDAKMKLLEIAAMDLGGNAEDYDVGDDKVFSKTSPKKNLTFAQAAQRAIELGGKYSGEEMNEDMHSITKASVTALAGTGLIGAAKDKYPTKGLPPALASSFIKIELDVETGKFEIIDYVGTADCGTVIHPQGLEHQIRGGGVMGIGMASLERIVYDPQNGLPANVGFHQTKPPSYLDVPLEMDVGYVDKPDPTNPVGARGIGEPLMGCAASALLSAISDALGGVYFNRTPVVPDMIINALAEKPQSYKTLQVSNQ
ncbi:MAG: xanthine dehydrogenase family protein molybdopterin-binding subunit [Rhodospirillales bacterium]|jgi:xanthine dehydrogenase molybdenum-binding subunit